MSKKLTVPSYEELYDLYSVKKFSISKLSKHYNTSNPTIRSWLIFHNIEKRTHKETCGIVNSQRRFNFPDILEFKEKYNTMSLVELQQEYSVGQETIYQWLKNFNLPIRDLSSACKLGKKKQHSDIQYDRDLIEETYNKYQNIAIAADSLNISVSHFRKLKDLYNIETKNSFRSQIEELLLSYCDDTFVTNNRSIINPYELDLYSSQQKLAIEYCGLYWHSEYYGQKSRDYHQMKYNICKSKDIELLTIFETDDLSKIKALIDRKLNRVEKLGARKTQLNLIDSSLANQFHTKYHLHGSIGGSIHLGLFDGPQLLMVASFGKSRFNRKFEYECTRMSSLDTLKVQGGASKLFKEFLSRKTSLITYADLRFGSGSVYNHCKLTYIGNTGPNYWYFNKKNPDRLWSRTTFQKHKLSSVLAEFNPNLTEFENMKLNGYDRIWDCGNAIYCTI